MSKFCAVAGLVAVMIVPAVAADQYNFTLDESKSKVTITLPAGLGSTSSPLSGTYSLKLDPPSGTYNTRNWNVLTSLNTINATNTSTMTLMVNSPPAPEPIYVRVDPGDFDAMDWNMNKAAIPSTTLAGGPNISSGAIGTSTFPNPPDGTEILVSIYNQLTMSYITNNGAAGEWIMMNWGIQVSDDDWLSVAGTGDVESHVSAIFIDTDTFNIVYDVQLYGRGTIPEPATMSLLALGGLALLRRRPV